MAKVEEILTFYTSVVDSKMVRDGARVRRVSVFKNGDGTWQWRWYVNKIECSEMYTKFVSLNEMESTLFHDPLRALPLLPDHADEFALNSTRFARLVDLHFDMIGRENMTTLTLALERHGFLGFSPYRMFVDAVDGAFGERLSQNLADVLASALPDLFEMFDTSNEMNLRTISDVIRATQKHYARIARKEVLRMRIRHGY